jgi:hypothetical protein
MELRELVCALNKSKRKKSVAPMFFIISKTGHVYYKQRKPKPKHKYKGDPSNYRGKDLIEEN